MVVTELSAGGGHCNVKLFSLKLCFKLFCLECTCGTFKCLFYFRAHVIGKLTDNGTLLGGKLTHSAQHRGELTFFSEIFDSDLFEVRTRIYGGDSLVKNVLQFFSHFFFLSVYVDWFLQNKKVPRPNRTRYESLAVPPVILAKANTLPTYNGVCRVSLLGFTRPAPKRKASSTRADRFQPSRSSLWRAT